MNIRPEFKSEAVSLAQIIGLAYGPEKLINDRPNDGFVRLIEEALQSAYETGRHDRC